MKKLITFLFVILSIFVLCSCDLQELPEAHEHTLVHVEKIDSTCKAEGKEAFDICNGCGKVFYNGNETTLDKVPVIAKKDHTPVVDAGIEATCTTPGLSEGSHCSVCGEVIIAQHETPTNNNHDFETVAKVDSTCKDFGVEAHKVCKDCEKVFTMDGVETTLAALQIAKKDHSVVVDAAVLPDCTHTGLTEGSHCSVCGEVLVAQQLVNAKGHTPAVDAAVLPDCTHTGLTEGSHCSVCDAVIVSQKVVDSLGHTWGNWYVKDEATPTQEGVMERECSVCHEKETKAYAFCTHETLVDVPAKAATCTEDGYTAHQACSNPNCPYTVGKTVIAALGHDYELHAASEPTYSQAGSKEYYSCKRDGCNEYFTKSGETYTKITLEAGQTIAEWAFLEKLVCDHSSLQTVDGLAATNEAAGYLVAYKCSTCGLYYADEDCETLIGDETAYNTWKTSGNGYIPAIGSDEDNYGSANAPKSVSDILAMYDATDYETKYKDHTVYATGKVSIESGKTYLVDNNDDTKKIQLYSLTGDTLYAGDSAKVSGTLTLFGSSKIKELSPTTVLSVTHSEVAVTVSADDNVTVTLTGVTNNKALTGTEVTVNMVFADGYQLKSIKVNGYALEATNSVYKFTVEAASTIEVVSINSADVKEYDYKSLAKYDFSDFDKTQSALGSSDLAAIQGKVVSGTNIITAFSATKVNKGYKESGDTGKEYYYLGFKFGTGSVSGSLKLTVSKDVAKVVVKFASWTATDTLSVNDSTPQSSTKIYKEYATVDAMEELTVIFDQDKFAKEITFKFVNRGYIATIEFFEAVEKEKCAHTMTHHDASPATCEADGTIEYWSCSKCGNNYANEAGTTKLTSIVDPAKGHDYELHAAVASTTTTHGSKEYYSCKREGCNEYFTKSGETYTKITLEQGQTIGQWAELPFATCDHSVTLVAGKDATTTEAGYLAAYKCSKCNVYFADEAHTQEIGDEAAYNLWKAEGGNGYLAKLPSDEDIYGSESKPKSVSDILAMYDATDYETKYKDHTVYATGKVSIESGKTYLVDATDNTKKIQLYSLTGDTLYAGDTAKVSGTLTMYYSTKELSPTTVLSVTHPSVSVTVSADDNVTVTLTGVTNNEAAIGTEVTVNMVFADGYQLKSIKVNGEKLEATDSVYKFTVEAASTIEVVSINSADVKEYDLVSVAKYDLTDFETSKSYSTITTAEAYLSRFQAALSSGTDILKAITQATSATTGYTDFFDLGIKMGTSNSKGSIEFEVTKNIGKVKVVFIGWKSGDKLIVNGVESVSATMAYDSESQDKFITAELTLTEFAKTIKFETDKRCYIQSIEFFEAVEKEKCDHTMTHHDASPATCEADGTVEYWSCSKCGNNYANEAGTTKLTSIVDPAKGHDYELHAAVTATTTTHGSKEYYSCKREGCNEYFTKSGETYTKITLEQGQTIGEWAYLGLATCDHSITTITGQEAKCYEAGYLAAYKCSKCGNYYSDEALTNLIGDETAYNTWKTTGDGAIAKPDHALVDSYELNSDNKLVLTHSCNNDGCEYESSDEPITALTVSELIAKYADIFTTEGQFSDSKEFVSGVVKSVNYYSNSSTYTVVLTDGTSDITSSYTSSEEDVVAGNIVFIYGYVNYHNDATAIYKKTINSETVLPEVLKQVAQEAQLANGENNNVHVTITQNGTHTGDEVKFTLKPYCGFEVKSVKVDGNTVTATEGVYTYTLSKAGDNTISVELKDTSSAGTSTVTVDYSSITSSSTAKDYNVVQNLSIGTFAGSTYGSRKSNTFWNFYVSALLWNTDPIEVISIKVTANSDTNGALYIDYSKTEAFDEKYTTSQSGTKISTNGTTFTCNLEGAKYFVIVNKGTAQCKIEKIEITYKSEAQPVSHEITENDKVAGSPATCAQNGSKEYYVCSNCGKKFTYNSETEKYEEIVLGEGQTFEQWLVITASHDLEHHDAKAPTCTEVGWDAYDTCKNCEYSTYVEKPALQHSYGDPTYSWNGANCTATRTCGNDASHTLTETKQATYVKDTDATCTANELGHYVVTFEDTQFGSASTEAKSVEIAESSLGHNYVYTNIVWTNFTAKAVYTCSHDSTHKEEHVCDVTSDVTTTATCSVNGVKTYTATFVGTDGTHTDTKTEDLGLNSNNHDWNNPEYNWNGTECTASRSCKNCTSVESEKVNGTPTVTQNKDCTHDELTKYTATFTNSAFTQQVKENVKTADKLGHTLTHHDLAYPTSSSNGNVEYWTCSECSGYFLDAEGTNATTAEGIVLSLEEAQVVSTRTLNNGSDILLLKQNKNYSYTFDKTNKSVSLQFKWQVNEIANLRFHNCFVGVSEWNEDHTALFIATDNKIFLKEFHGDVNKQIEMSNAGLTVGLHTIKFTRQAIMNGDTFTGKYLVFIEFDGNVIESAINEYTTALDPKVFINSSCKNVLYDINYDLAAENTAISNAEVFSVSDIEDSMKLSGVNKIFDTPTSTNSRIFKFKLTLDQLNDSSELLIYLGKKYDHSCVFWFQGGNAKNFFFNWDTDAHYSDRYWLNGDNNSGLEVGHTYEIEMGRVRLTNGKDLVFLKVDGNYLYNDNRPSWFYVDPTSQKGYPFAENKVSIKAINYTLTDISKTFESADTISVNDLVYDGQYQNNQIALDSNMAYSYHSTSQYGSVIFKGVINIPSSSFTNDQQGHQFRFNGNDGWDNEGMIWVRHDGTLMIKNGSNSWGTKLTANKDVNVEIGRLAIMDGDTFTGKHYIYISFDGVVAQSYVSSAIAEKYYTSSQIFITGNEFVADHVIKNVAINKTVTVKVRDYSENVTVLQSGLVVIPSFNTTVLPENKAIVGWKVEGTDKAFVPQSTRVFDDVTIVAEIKDNWLVTFGNDSSRVVDGNTIVAPENPTKDFDETNHYEFDGWYIVGTNTKFATGDKATADVVYEARFTSIPHNYDNWVIDEEATCTEVGSKHRDCACGYTENAEIEIDSENHDFIDHICSRCSEFEDSMKFYLEVTSENSVKGIVGDDYNATLIMPSNGNVNTESVTLLAVMQNVASLGVSTRRSHSVTVNTSFGSKEVNLKTWLSNIYSFEGGEIRADIDGHQVTYQLSDITNNKIYGTTDTLAARAAWQALTSHVSTSTQDVADSFIEIANGSYILMGTEYLRFEDDYEGNLKLDNFSNLSALEQSIRDAVTLDTCVNQGGRITMVIKAGTKLALGNTVATLDDDYMIIIELSDAGEMYALKDSFATLRSASGAYELVKELVLLVNKVVGVIDSCEYVKVIMQEESAHTHNYANPTYKWVGNTCTATLTCSLDPTHKIEVAMNVEYVKDTNATCTTNEFGHYLATSTDNRLTSQTTEANSVEKQGSALNHNYEFKEIVWDGFTAKAIYECSHDSAHKEEHVCEISSDITTVANCTTDGIRTYTATYDGHQSTKEENLGLNEDNHYYVDHLCTRCEDLEDNAKFFLEVSSGNKINMVVGDDYNLVVRLPEDGNVNTESVTLLAVMQHVESLSVSGVKSHQISVNTGFGSKSVNLRTWLSKAYNFEATEQNSVSIKVNIDGKEVTYNFYRDDLKIYGTTNTVAARTAWQALTSHVSTSTQTEDDSFIEIANGSFLMIGTEFLRFEDDYEGNLVLNDFSNLSGIEAAIREAVMLDTCSDQGGTIKAFVKAGTKLAVGSTIATLDDDYMVEIVADKYEMGNLFGSLESLRSASGSYDITKKLVELFNEVIGVVNACSEVKVNMHKHELVHHDAVSETCEEAGNVEYWSCSECEKNYSDSLGYVELANEVIQPKNHNYAYTFTWSEDGNSITATRVCSHDSSHTDSETLTYANEKISANVTQDKSCTEDEYTTYTVGSFANSDFNDNIPNEKKTVVVKTADKLDHEYEYTYTWAEDGKSITATRVCSHDSSHTDSETLTYANEKISANVTQDKSCTEDEYTTYTVGSFANSYFNDNIPNEKKTVVVKTCDASHSGVKDVWTKVTDASTLKVGDKITIVSSGYNFAIGKMKTSNFGHIAVSKNDTLNTVDLVNNTDTSFVQIELVEGYLKNTFGFKLGNVYLYASSSKSNELKTTQALDNNGSWTISISNGVATIKANGTNTRNWIRYNSTNSLFSCYGSGQDDVCIYILSSNVVDATATNDSNDGTYKYYVCEDCGCYIAYVGDEWKIVDSFVIPHTYDLTKWVNLGNGVDGTHAHGTTCGHDVYIDEEPHNWGDDDICDDCGETKYTSFALDVTITNNDLGLITYNQEDIEHINSGESVTLTIKPNEHCFISEFTVDGVSKLANIVDNKYTITMDADCDVVVKFDVPRGTQDNPLTVAQLLDSIEAFIGSDTNKNLDEFYVTGYVSYDNYTGYYRFYLVSSLTDAEPDSIYVYSTSTDTGVSKADKGDLVVIKGTAKLYNSVYELINGSLVISNTRATRTASLGTVSNDIQGKVSVQFTNGVNTGYKGDSFTFTITKDSDVLINKVSVNDVAVNAVSDVYTGTFDYESVITIDGEINACASGHNFSGEGGHVDAKASTCLEQGNIEYWHCSNCDSYFSDAQGEHKITTGLQGTKLPLANHTFGEEVSGIYECSVCHRTASLKTDNMKVASGVSNESDFTPSNLSVSSNYSISKANNDAGTATRIYSSTIRLYSGSGNGGSMTVTNSSDVISSIIISCKGPDNLSIYVDGTIISKVDGKFIINSKTFTIKNTGSSTSEISNIAISYYALNCLPGEHNFDEETHTCSKCGVKESYTITFEKNGGSFGSDNIVSSYYYGDTVELPTNISKSSNVFNGWYSSSDFSGNAVTLIASTDFGNKTFYAKWTEVVYYTINKAATTNGTVTTSVESSMADSEITITATPESGYIVDTITVVNDTTSQPITVTNNKFTMPASSVTVSVTFKVGTAPSQYAISFNTTNATVTNTSGTTITSGNYDAGTFSFKVTPNTGYSVYSVKCSIAGNETTLTPSDGVYSFNLTGDAMITIEISKEYTISSSGKSWKKTGGSVIESSVTWNYTSASYLAAGGTDQKYVQIGSKNNPQTTGWTISTSGISGNIKSITINGYSAGSGTYQIKVGTTVVQSGSLSSSNTSYSATSIDLSGEISITIVGTSKAQYLGGIVIVYVPTSE